MPSLNAGRSEHSSCIQGSYLYIIGGCDKDWNYVESMERVALRDDPVDQMAERWNQIHLQQ